VSEGSNLVYTVSVSTTSASPREIALLLGAEGDTAIAVEDYNAAYSAYTVVDGVRTDLAIAGGRVSLPAGMTTFFVSVGTVQDRPPVLEGGERLTLTATLAGGASDRASRVIIDDGTGRPVDEIGQPVPGPVDDDRLDAFLDPASDNGMPDDLVTSMLDPAFTISAGSLLTVGDRARLLDPQGNVVGEVRITPEDVSTGQVKIPTLERDDGVYVYNAQVLDANGQLKGERPVVVTIVTDLDGIAPSIERAANGGDFNKDGQQDWSQNNVAHFPMTSVAAFQAGAAAAPATFGAILAGDVPAATPGAAVRLDPGAQLLDITMRTLSPTLPAAYKAVSPMFQFSLTSVEGGQLADMDPTLAGLQTRAVIDLAEGVLANTYLKLDPANNTWYEFLDDQNLVTYDSGATLIDMNRDGKIDRVVLTFTDGGTGDADGVANGMIADPGVLALKQAPVYSVLLASGDRYYSTDASEVAAKARGAGNVFEGVRFDTLDKELGGKQMFAHKQPFTMDWYFAAEGGAMPYECYMLMPEETGFFAAAAGQGPGLDYHLYLNTAGITQLVTQAEAATLGLAAAGYRDMGAQFNTTNSSAFSFDAEGYLIANQGNADVQQLVSSLATQFQSTSSAGFVEAVEQDFLARVALTGLPHGESATVNELNAAFGTTFLS
jgi:hypothetical protein